MTATNQTEAKYFDLHTTGIGYLGRIREVKLKKGEPFWACTIAALCGECKTPDSKEKTDYTYFDCNIVGSEAQKLIKRSAPAVAAGKKVLVGFVIGDIRLDRFVYDKGEKKGETGASLKGRLLRIRWIKVDGDMVYTEPPKDAVAPSNAPVQPETENPTAPAPLAEPPEASSADSAKTASKRAKAKSLEAEKSSGKKALPSTEEDEAEVAYF